MKAIELPGRSKRSVGKFPACLYDGGRQAELPEEGYAVEQKQKRDYPQIPFTGLGLIFGTAIGAIFALILTGDIIWAGAGTGIGLVIGAAIDSMKKRK